MSRRSSLTEVSRTTSCTSGHPPITKSLTTLSRVSWADGHCAHAPVSLTYATPFSYLERLEPPKCSCSTGSTCSLKIALILSSNSLSRKHADLRVYYMCGNVLFQAIMHAAGISAADPAENVGLSAGGASRRTGTCTDPRFRYTGIKTIPL